MPKRIRSFRPPGLRAKARPTAAARGYCTPEWRRTRLAVIARDQGVCQMCGVVVMRMAQVDHIVEKAVGGDDRLSNLRLLCLPCHSSRHAADHLGQRRRD